MFRAFVAAACLAFALPAGAVGLTYAEAKALADRDEAALPAEESDALINAWGEAFAGAFGECGGREVDSAAPAPFTIVVELDAQGRSLHTWRQGDSALAACVERELAGELLSVPPRAPFYTFFAVSFEK